MKDKNILITGGAGFVGSALAKTLSEHNKVISLDNYFTGSKLNHLEKVAYVEGDVKDIQNIFINESFDLIYHLGEYSRVEQSYKDYDFVNRFNILNFSCILDFSKDKDAKLIYSGSSTKFALYDAEDTHSPYSWSKKKNTEHLQLYAKWIGLDYAITYFYNVYGEGEINTGKYSTVVAKFLESYKSKSDCVTVVEPGTQKRYFTHINDVVSALVLVGESGRGDGYGIGSDEPYTILELAEMIGLPIKMSPKRRGNRMDAELVIEKTKALGWQCKNSLENYITEMKKSFQD